jgi:hypothetical protein
VKLEFLEPQDYKRVLGMLNRNLSMPQVEIISPSLCCKFTVSSFPKAESVVALE